MKVMLKFIGFFLLLSIVGTIIKVVFFPAHVANKAVDTAYKITDKVLDADNVLQNYEFFKQQYQDYLAIDKKIANAEQAVKTFEGSAGTRDKWTFEDKTEHARLSTIVTGLKQQKEDIISQYNAKSKMQNRSLFKTKDLPSELN